MDDLLSRIEDAIPLITLALTTSGANLSARMPDSVSPGRFLQAGNYLRKADDKFEALMAAAEAAAAAATVSPSSMKKNRHHQPHHSRVMPIRVQIGPAFNLVLYTIFYGTMRNPHLASSSDITWKEEHARCQIKLWRVNSAGADSLRGDGSSTSFDEEFEYQYMMTIDESFNDGRYHDKEERPASRAVDISAVTRLFFSASGKLLQIEESRSPVLVLKLNVAFDPGNIGKSNKRGDGEGSDTASEGDLSDPEDESFIYEQNHEHLAASTEHVEWLAFEQYSVTDLAEDLEEDYGDPDSSDDEEAETSAGLSSGLQALDLSPPAHTSSPLQQKQQKQQSSRPKSRPTSAASASVSGSLSLLEYIVRISALQSNDQDSVYNIPDERIALYLRDESATGGSASSSNAAPSSVQSMNDSPVRQNEAPGLPRNTQRRRSNITPGGTSIKRSGGGSGSGSGVAESRYDSPRTPVQFPAIKVQTSQQLRQPSNTNQKQQQQQSQQRPQQQQQQQRDQTPVGTPLTPWEKDRLRTRRQLLLHKRDSAAAAITNHGLQQQISQNQNQNQRVTTTAATSESEVPNTSGRGRQGQRRGVLVVDEDRSDRESLWDVDSPLRAKSKGHLGR